VYLNNIKLLFIQPCVAESKKIRFKAEFSSDVSNIMPYLNSVVKNGSYNSNMPSFTFKKDNRLINIYANDMTVAKAINETDAYSIMDFVKDLINETYDNKNSIEPNYEMRKKPSAFKIYSYLPKKNCKKCGETTCIAFASKLLTGVKTLNQCAVLEEEQYKEKLKSLNDLLELV